MFLDYFALGLLIFVAISIFYGIIAIHDIPYEMSKKRNHPHQDAIHVAGWVSLFTLHVLWPFIWIWATLWREDRGWGFTQIQQEQEDVHHRVDVLSDKISELQEEIRQLNQTNGGAPKPAVETATKTKADVSSSSTNSSSNQEGSL